MQNITGMLFPGNTSGTGGIHQNYMPQQPHMSGMTQNDTSGIGYHQPSLHKQVFSPGKMLRVMRTSGAIEPDWHIFAIAEDGKLVVQKDGLQKTYNPSQLQQILLANPELVPYGASLRVLRSSGAHEEGWQASGMHNDRIILTHNGLRKDVSIQSLLSENPELLPPEAQTSHSDSISTPQYEAQQVNKKPASASARRSPVFATYELAKDEAYAILNKAKFMPNPAGFYPGEAKALTKEFLASKGLEPVLSISCGDKNIHISKPYANDGDSRPGFVAYIEDKDGNVNVRTFYLSKSQGLWRCASHFGPAGWIGKGAGSEQSTNLPIPMQKILYSKMDQGIKKLSKDDADTAFYGGLSFGGHEPPKEFGNGMKMDSLGSFDRKTNEGFGDPATFTLSNPGQNPNFGKPEDRYSFNHPMHGLIEAFIYPSYDSTTRYMFCRDSSNRNWVASVEDAGAPLTGFGVRSHVIEPGNMTMPALEYAEQVPSEYKGRYIHPPYVDASSYTHSLPVVKAFMRATGAGL